MKKDLDEDFDGIWWFSDSNRPVDAIIFIFLLFGAVEFLETFDTGLNLKRLAHQIKHFKYSTYLSDDTLLFHLFIFNHLQQFPWFTDDCR